MAKNFSQKSGLSFQRVRTPWGFFDVWEDRNHRNPDADVSPLVLNAGLGIKPSPRTEILEAVEGFNQKFYSKARGYLRNLSYYGTHLADFAIRTGKRAYLVWQPPETISHLYTHYTEETPDEVARTDEMIAEREKEPIFIEGHSMGTWGQYLAQSRLQNELAGVFINPFIANAFSFRNLLCARWIGNAFGYLVRFLYKCRRRSRIIWNIQRPNSCSISEIRKYSCARSKCSRFTPSFLTLYF